MNTEKSGSSMQPEGESTNTGEGEAYPKRELKTHKTPKKYEWEELPTWVQAACSSLLSPPQDLKMGNEIMEQFNMANKTITLEWIRDLYMLCVDLISNAGLHANGPDFECLKKAHNYLVVEKLI